MQASLSFISRPFTRSSRTRWEEEERGVAEVLELLLVPRDHSHGRTPSPSIRQVEKQPLYS